MVWPVVEEVPEVDGVCVDIPGFVLVLLGVADVIEPVCWPLASVVLLVPVPG